MAKQTVAGLADAVEASFDKMNGFIQAQAEEVSSIKEHLETVDRATFEAVADLQKQIADLEKRLENQQITTAAPREGTTYCPQCRQYKVWGRLGCPSSVCLQRAAKSIQQQAN